MALKCYFHNFIDENIYRTGFVPGEIIGFQAEVDNKSNEDMEGSELKLLEHIRYTGTRGFST